MREHIKQILEAGGTVVFPDKEEHQSWLREAKVYGHAASSDNDKTPTYYVECEEFKDAGEAADEYIKRVFTRKNVGLAHAYWLQRGVDLENLDEDEAATLISGFNTDIFHRLYPFVTEE